MKNVDLGRFWAGQQAGGVDFFPQPAARPFIIPAKPLNSVGIGWTNADFGG